MGATDPQLIYFKTLIGATGNTYDDDLKRLLQAAFDLAERYTGLKLDSGTATTTDTFDGDGSTVHILQKGPLVSVQSVTVGSTTYTLSPDYNTTGYWTKANKVMLRKATFTAPSDSGTGNCAIAYTYGYATLPDPLLQAVFEMASLWWEARNRLGKKSSTMGQSNETFEATVLTDQVKATLNQYRRFGP